MNFAQKSTTLVYLASAFALPPKIVNLDWSLAARSNFNIPEKRARSVELVTRTYSEMSVSGNLPKANSPKDTQGTASSQRFDFKEGVFEASGRQLAFISREQKDRNLWSIPVGFEPLVWERARARTGLVAWDIYPSIVFFLDWGDRQSGAKALGYKINWSEDTELLRFFECHYGHWVLVENLPNGMTRVFFVEKDVKGELTLKNYTVFDFNPKGNSSEVLKVENEGCHTFYFSGTFGKARVRY